jgi:hypothetical protein
MITQVQIDHGFVGGNLLPLVQALPTFLSFPDGLLKFSS